VTGKSPNSNGQLVIQKIQSFVQMIAGLGMMDRVDPDGLLMAMSQALELPNNAKILKTPEQIQIEQQQQLAQQLAGAGVPGQPPMAAGQGVPMPPGGQGYG
jgi:hypothetical protein